MSFTLRGEINDDARQNGALHQPQSGDAVKATAQAWWDEIRIALSAQAANSLLQRDPNGSAPTTHGT